MSLTIHTIWVQNQYYLLDALTLVMCLTNDLPLFLEVVDKLSLKSLRWWSNDTSNYSNTFAHYMLPWDIFLQLSHTYGFNHSSDFACTEILRCSHSAQPPFCNSWYGKLFLEWDNSETSIFCHDAVEVCYVLRLSEELNFSIIVQMIQ